MSFAGKMNRQGLNKMHDMGAPRPGPIKVQARWKQNRVDPGPGTKESKKSCYGPSPAMLVTARSFRLSSSLDAGGPREGMFSSGRLP